MIFKPLEESPYPPQQLAQMIIDRVTEAPNEHDQHDWENINRCGTTRCVAGWADFFVNGRVTINTVDVRAARYLGLETELIKPDGFSTHLYEACGDDADNLFLGTNNEQAVEALRYIARGEPINWGAVWGTAADANED